MQMKVEGYVYNWYFIFLWFNIYCVINSLENTVIVSESYIIYNI
jgi:hypothetical protein